MAGEKVINPLFVWIFGIVVFLVLISIMWSWIYDVKFGSAAGAVLCYFFNLFSPNILGPLCKKVVETIIWF